MRVGGSGHGGRGQARGRAQVMIMLIIMIKIMMMMPRTRKLFERRGLSPSSAPASTESDANNTARSLEDIMRYDTARSPRGDDKNDSLTF